MPTLRRQSFSSSGFWGLMRMSTRPTLSRLLALVAVAACAVPLACGGGDDPDDPPRASTPAAPATTSPESEVESAYLAYWDMVVRVTGSPQADNTEIAQHAIDPARAELTASVTEFRAAGQAVEIGPEYRHTVSDVAVAGELATLSDCAVDDASVVIVASGEVARQSTTTSALTVNLRLKDGAWLVENVTSTRDWDGVTEC